MNLSESTQRRNPGLFRLALSEHQNTDGTWRDGHEPGLQSACEARLTELDFYPLSEGRIAGVEPKRGWYIHQAMPRKHAILLDLLILPHNAPAVQIELKTRNGRLNQNQIRLLKYGQNRHMYVCRTVAEMEDALHGEGVLDDVADQKNYPRSYRDAVDHIKGVWECLEYDSGVRDDAYRYLWDHGEVDDEMKRAHETGERT